MVSTQTGTNRVEFFVPGIPRPGGSKKGFYNAKIGRVMMTKAGGRREENWRQAVSFAAMQAMGDREPLRGPILLDVTFFMPRPKSHFRAGKHAGELKPDAPSIHISKPDRTKLLRGTEDAMKGIVWADDSQVWGGSITKLYGSRPGAKILVIHGDAPEAKTHVQVMCERTCPIVAILEAENRLLRGGLSRKTARPHEISDLYDARKAEAADAEKEKP